MTDELLKIPLKPTQTSFGYGGVQGQQIVTAALLSVSALNQAGYASEASTTIEPSSPERIFLVESSSTVHGLPGSPTLEKLKDSIAQLSRLQANAIRAIDGLTAEISDIKTKVQALEISSPDTSEPSNSLAISELLDRSRISIETGDEATAGSLLDLAADRGFVSPEIEAMAIGLIDASDPFVRSAAARVIALNNSALALETLPTLIDRERNLTAKTIMKAALRSVSA